MTATTPRAGGPPVAERRRPAPDVAAGRRAWVLVALATVASLAARLVLARWVDGPFIFQDEGGYVGVARALAGQDPDLYGPTYHPLWGLLLAPAAALLEPGGQQTAAQVLNAVAAVATIPVLHLIGRRVLGVAPLTSALAAVAGGLTAASFVQATMLLPEALLGLLVATTVLFVHEALRRRTVGWAVAAGVVAGAAYGAHPRALVLVLAVVIVSLVAWRTGVVDRRSMVAAVGSALATSASLQLLHAWATARLYPSGTQPSVAGSPLGAVTEPVASALIALGQAWYLVAASLGLAVLGAVAAGRLAWTQRHRATGLTALVVVLGALGSLALGTGASYEVPLADEVHRADLPVYGRYLEQWLPVLVAWAPVLPRRWRRPAVAITAMAVVAAALGLRAVYDPETWRQPVAWHNVSTLRVPYEVIGRDHLAWTAVAVGVASVLAALPRSTRDGRWLVPLAAVAAVNVVAGHWLVRDWAGPSAARWAERQVIAPALVASGEPAWVDLDEYHEIAWAYHAQFWHPDLEVRYFEGAVPPEATHLVARTGGAPAPGATMVLAEPHGDYGLWTRPPR